MFHSLRTRNVFTFRFRTATFGETFERPLEPVFSSHVSRQNGDGPGGWLLCGVRRGKGLCGDRNKGLK